MSFSNNPSEVAGEIKEYADKIFFHKRLEWEHEQEYRLLKRCPLATMEEYLFLGDALKFVILSSKLRNVDEVLHFKKIKEIKEKIGKIPVLIYGNGLFDYALCTEDAEEGLWNSEEGYDILIIGENCELDLS